MPLTDACMTRTFPVKSPGRSHRSLKSTPMEGCHAQFKLSDPRRNRELSRRCVAQQSPLRAAPLPRLCKAPRLVHAVSGPRPRKFYILCEKLVQTVSCLVIRRRCPGCRQTYTQQPPFAFPRKRYTRESILGFSTRHVEDEAATYRATVLNDEGMPIFHALSSEGNVPGYRGLAHSTPYRWITTLSGFKQILRTAQDLILQENPAPTVCRKLATIEISGRKYLKAARESVLKRCRQLFRLEVRFRAGVVKIVPDIINYFKRKLFRTPVIFST